MKLNRNFKKLRRLIEDEEMLQKELAELAGIPIDTLKTRLRTPEEESNWRSCEIRKICKVLHIPRSQIGEYFFPKVEDDV